MATTKKETEKSLIQKLCNIQVELKAPKNQYNSFGEYRYRSCSDILEALKPYLKEFGLSILITDEVVLLGSRFYVKATARLTDGIDEICATAYAREEEAKKKLDASQITGVASSYARKYALNGLLAIDDTKDADALNTSKDYTQPSDESVKAAINELNMATTPNELNNAWNRHADLQGNKEFLNVMQVRCSEFRNK